MPLILQVKNLNIDFGEEVIIKNLSFDLAKGESLAIIGPNGSGKTTLLRALIGTISFEGEIQWAEDEIVRQSAFVAKSRNFERGEAKKMSDTRSSLVNFFRKAVAEICGLEQKWDCRTVSNVKIGYVPQKIDLEKRLPLTLEDFLMTKIKIKNRPRTDLEKVLKLVNLKNELLKKPLAFLSSGQFQRATIAFALIDNPNVLILDEPTSGVDLPGEEKVYDTIHRLQEDEKLSVIIVSHDLSLVYRYANKVLCINRQEICYGEPQEVLTPEQLQKVYGERVMYQHGHG